MVAESVAGADRRDAGPAAEYMLEPVAAVCKGDGNGCDESLKFGESRSIEDYNEVIAAKMNCKFSSVVIGERIELCTEQLYCRTSDVGTEISVDLVNVFDVDERNGVFCCDTCGKHLIESVEEIIGEIADENGRHRLVHRELRTFTWFVSFMIFSKIESEDDYDMKSERTGYSIAEIRANIQKLTWIRDYEILPAYNNFKHFYNCLINSPKSNKESYEIKRVYKEFKRLEYELKEIRKAIKDEREYVRNYINKKEELYQRLRKGKTN